MGKIVSVNVLPHKDKRHEGLFSCVPADRQSVAALERSRKGPFCVSGRCFVVTNGRTSLLTGDQTAETRGLATSGWIARPMTRRGEIPESRLVGHVRQCHCGDWPSRRHHKASSSDRQSASANGPAWAALRKHRMISSDTKSALCGPRREWRSVATTQNLQVNLTKRMTHVTGAG